MSEFGINSETYVFANGDERDRLIIQHDGFKPKFLGILQRVLDDYGLAERMKQARQHGTKVSILDAGCGEGLFLHDVAQEIAERSFLDVIDLNGFDRDALAISLANEFKTVLKPPRPYLNFYVHDLRTPFEENPALKEANKLQFDFIYATLVVEHIPNSQKIVADLYQHLKPGGVIYLRDTLVTEVDYFAPTPAMAIPTKAFRSYVASLNPEVVVAKENVNWLKALGATQLQVSEDMVYADGDSPQHIEELRNWVLGIKNSLPKVVETNRMSQAEADALMDKIYQELNGDPRGYWKLLDTLARKPETDK